MSAVTSVVEEVAPAAAAGPAASPRFLRRLLRRPVAIACLAYLALIVVIAIVAPIALPHVAGEDAGDLTAVHQGPSGAHLLGTDTLGRDVLDRLLVGTRVTMAGVAEALVVVLALGVPLGLAAGYFGGWIDRLVTWLADLTFSIPAIILIVVVLSVFPQSMPAAMVTLGVIMAPALMRVVRAATLPVRQELSVAAAQVSGLSRPYIITRHVLPRISGALIVQVALLSGVALLVQTGLAFLGLVVPAPAPSWGGMVADGIGAIDIQSWLIWPPGIVIALTILACGLLGDVVRDATTENWAPVVRRPRARRSARARRGSHAPAETDRLGSPAAGDGAPDAETLLAIERLSIAFRTSSARVPVLVDVSFDVRAGETVGLVGESGCGKTITAMAVLGLLPGTATVESGRIRFGEHDLASVGELGLRAIRGKEIGLISQEPMISLDPAFRVGSQLTEAVRRHHRVSRRAAQERVLELLGQVQLPDPSLVARRYPHELSGGMAQRVAIARALAGEPQLLIADEPTTALDVTVQAEVLDLLREIQRERGMAILLVTHDWGVVADMCDRAVVMYAGEVVERADLLPMFREPRHPYTEALLASNPHHVVDAEALPTIPGSVPQPGEWPRGCHFHPRCTYATDACREAPIALEQIGSRHETRCIHHDRLARAT